MSIGRMTNGASHFRGTLVPCVAAVLLSACSPSTQVQKAGRDQDITRDINWELHLRRDPGLESVSAFCVDGVVTLEGRVDTKSAEQEAIQIAISKARGALVVTKLEIRAR